jgi:predicted dehydrogenase
MRPIARRQFLQESLIATGLAATAAAARADTEEARQDPAPDDPVSPNEAVRVAIMGVRGRGMEQISGFAKQKHARIVAICDCDRNVIGPAMLAIKARYGAEPKYYQDIRKLLEDDEIDALAIAAPNHWHALATVWACQAGKDVYVEKPATHDVAEGPRMIEAARKYGRIVQVGTQCRSHRGIQQAIEFLRSGKLGTVYMAKGLCYKPRGSIGHTPDSAVPEGLDYDLWCGPAEMRPFNANRLHYNWHWFWNTGNGDLGNQGVHQMDLARWGLGKNELPKRVSSTGGRLGYDDDGETPNTQTVQLEFDDALLQFEVRGLSTNDELGVRIGDIFYGTEGILAISSYETWQTFLGPKLERGPGGTGGGDHFANFLDAVRGRDPAKLAAPIVEGHLSAAYCHVGNIAYRLGRSLRIDPQSEAFVGDDEANALLDRTYRSGFKLTSLG